MPHSYPRRRLEDWSPAEGPLDRWLAELASDGWHPEHNYGGIEVRLHGQTIRRFAMIQHAPPRHGDD